LLVGAVLLALGCGGQIEADHSPGGLGGSAANTVPATGGRSVGDAGPADGAAPLGPGEDFAVISDAQWQAITACAGMSGSCEPSPLILELVVDLGQSMARLSPNGAETNWERTQAMLFSVLGGLGASASVGISFYPNRPTQPNGTGPLPASACIDSSGDMPMSSLGQPGSAVHIALDQALSVAKADPTAGTPTHDAYLGALGAVESALPPPVIVLVTEGQPTLAQGCFGTGAATDRAPTAPIVEEIRAAAARNIATIVVGTPGSALTASGDDARPWLADAARAGQTGPCDFCQPSEFCHIDMTSSSDPAQALLDLVSLRYGCRPACVYTLPVSSGSLTIDPDQVSLVYSSDARPRSLIRRSEGEPCHYGWHFVDESTIEICDQTCQQIQCDPGAAVEPIFGCTPR
jgi:hypothetical protein